jgi:hypothetical protein
LNFLFDSSLGVFAVLRKANVGFGMSVCLSVRPSVRPSVRVQQLGCHWTDFHEISDFSIVENLP